MQEAKYQIPDSKMHDNIYDKIAEEYYDKNLHPTSNNFRSLGIKAFKDFFSQYISKLGRVLEIGAGKTIFAEIDERINDDTFLIISDKSQNMLQRSLECKLNMNEKINFLLVFVMLLTT